MDYFQNILLMKQKLNLSLFLLLFIACQAAAQQFTEKKPAGIVGGKIITTDEYMQRYELNPKPGMKPKDKNLGVRLQFLQSLIAEKLWAQEAEALGLDSTEAMIIATESFQNMFLRDALYKKEIREKVTISDKELFASLKKYRTKYYVNYLITQDDREVRSLHALLKQGVPFDTVLSARPEYEEQPGPVEIVYGQMPDEIEDSLFTMEPGQFTGPLESPDGLYIFFVRNKVLQTSQTMTPDDELKDAEKILRARKEQKRFREFMTGFMKGKKVTISAPFLKYFSIKLHDAMMQKQIDEKISGWDKLEVSARDVNRFLNSIPADSQQMTFIQVDERTYSLRKYFLMEAFNGLNFEDIRAEELFRNFHRRIRKFIEHDQLAIEARSLGFLTLPEVQTDITIWRDNYLFQALRSQFTDSVTVTDQEAMDYYKRYNKEIHYPAQVNILEILSDNQETISYCLNLINQGADFRAVADSFTIRKSTQGKGGEFGWFPVIMYGELGRIAADLQVGDIYGPIKTSDGYSLIKLIGKKEDYIEYPKKSYEQLKNEIKSNIGYGRLKNKIDNYTASLAVKYGFSMDPDLLGELDLTEINSIGMRYLGFGGSVTGVPIIAPNFDWYPRYLQMIKALP